MRLQAVPVFVRDHDLALAFYRDTLEFTVVVDTKEAGMLRWVMLAPQQGGPQVILYRPVMPLYGETIETLTQRIGRWTGIFFEAEDIQATYERLRQRGVTFTSAPTMQPWGQVGTVFSDPDGNLFHLLAAQ